MCGTLLYYWGDCFAALAMTILMGTRQAAFSTINRRHGINGIVLPFYRGDCFAALAMTGLVAVGNGLAPFRTPRDRVVTGNEGIGQAAFPTINR